MNWLFGLCLDYVFTKHKKQEGQPNKLIPKGNIDNIGNIGTYGSIDNRQIVNGNAESKQSETNVENK